MLYSNNYINFDLVNKNILLFNLNKAKPENNEWYEMKDALTKFFECCLQKKFKVSLLFDITKSDVIDHSYLLDFVNWLQNNEEIIENCISCSSIICNNTLVKTIVNGILMIYSTKKPFKICKNSDEAYLFINEHNSVSMNLEMKK